MSDAMADNPLLVQVSLPRFDAIRPEHVEPAISHLIAEQRARVAQIEALTDPTFKTVVEPYLVAGRAPERRDEFRGTARRVQRLPAAAVRLPH
jgi:Zn-dependent oligopeptidase